MPLVRNAVTLRACQPARSSRRTTAILVSKLLTASTIVRRTARVLYVPGVGERVRAWRPDVPGVAEVFHAHFVDHASPAHTHEAWTLLLVDDGAVRYDLDRHEHGALPT